MQIAPEAIPAFVTLGLRHWFGGSDFPPGAIPVEERMLARYVTPGAAPEPHGVPPIGVIGLPDGHVWSDDFEDDAIRVFPFRFQWYRQSYALSCGDTLYAIVRNVQQMEVSVGMYAVVQTGDAHNWETFFGVVKKSGLASVAIELPNAERKTFVQEDIHFVGRVVAWWDEAAESEVWIEPE